MFTSDQTGSADKIYYGQVGASEKKIDRIQPNVVVTSNLLTDAQVRKLTVMLYIHKVLGRHVREPRRGHEN